MKDMNNIDQISMQIMERKTHIITVHLYAWREATDVSALWRERRRNERQIDKYVDS